MSSGRQCVGREGRREGVKRRNKEEIGVRSVLSLSAEDIIPCRYILFNNSMSFFYFILLV